MCRPTPLRAAWTWQGPSSPTTPSGIPMTLQTVARGTKGLQGSTVLAAGAALPKHDGQVHLHRGLQLVSQRWVREGTAPTG